MNVLRGILLILILAAAVGFAIYNAQPVALKYYFGWVSVPLPLFLWAFFALFLGLVIAGLMGFWSKLTLRGRIRQRKKELARMEEGRVGK